jgi:hypothetical protein
MDPRLRVGTAAGSHGALRQQREISEPLKGSAKNPKVTLSPVGERVRRLSKCELGPPPPP